MQLTFRTRAARRPNKSRAWSSSPDGQLKEERTIAPPGLTVTTKGSQGDDTFELDIPMLNPGEKVTASFLVNLPYRPDVPAQVYLRAKGVVGKPLEKSDSGEPSWENYIIGLFAGFTASLFIYRKK